MSNNLQLISLNLEKDLLDKMRSSLGETRMTDFIREAIQTKLDNGANQADEFDGMKKKVEQLNPELLENKVCDIEIKVQLIFEELKKQRTILKTMYKRTTVGANFSMHILDEIKKSTEFSTKEHKELLKIIEDELKKNWNLKKEIYMNKREALVKKAQELLNKAKQMELEDQQKVGKLVLGLYEKKEIKDVSLVETIAKVLGDDTVALDIKSSGELAKNIAS